MNSIADMGGMHGLGPIVVEKDEPVFHAEWERRMFALFLLTSAGGHFNVDMSRYAMEQMPAAEYLAASYYERWLHAVMVWGQASGALREDEIQARMRDIEMGAA